MSSVDTTMVVPSGFRSVEAATAAIKDVGQDSGMNRMWCSRSEYVESHLVGQPHGLQDVTDGLRGGTVPPPGLRAVLPTE